MISPPARRPRGPYCNKGCRANRHAIHSRTFGRVSLVVTRAEKGRQLSCSHLIRRTSGSVRALRCDWRRRNRRCSESGKVALCRDRSQADRYNENTVVRYGRPRPKSAPSAKSKLEAARSHAPNAEPRDP